MNLLSKQNIQKKKLLRLSLITKLVFILNKLCCINNHNFII